jgi:hypothetical protein
VVVNDHHHHRRSGGCWPAGCAAEGAVTTEQAYWREVLTILVRIDRKLDYALTQIRQAAPQRAARL